MVILPDPARVVKAAADGLECHIARRVRLAAVQVGTLGPPTYGHAILPKPAGVESSTPDGFESLVGCGRLPEIYRLVLRTPAKGRAVQADSTGVSASTADLRECFSGRRGGCAQFLRPPATDLAASRSRAQEWDNPLLTYLTSTASERGVDSAAARVGGGVGDDTTAVRVGSGVGEDTAAAPVGGSVGEDTTALSGTAVAGAGVGISAASGWPQPTRISRISSFPVISMACRFVICHSFMGSRRMSGMSRLRRPKPSRVR